MQAIKAIPGVSNLNSIVATASSSRILNLHALGVELTGEAADNARPLFMHPVLNRAIIVKHNVRPGEEEPLAPRRFNATKVIFPFEARDLGLGGQYLFVEQPDFVQTLTQRLEYGDLSSERDIAVLRILDGLPTLDPFLVREALAKHRIEVDTTYYRFSEPDKAHMLGFVERQIEALIDLCFGERRAGDTRAKRLSQLLLADHDSPELEPLQMTLRMEGSRFAEAMFAWKAFLYYRWRTQMLTPSLKTTLRSLSRINRRRYDSDGLRFVIAAKSTLERAIAKAWREIGARLGVYDDAYRGLTENQNPESFRQFLSSGSVLFLELGERIGRLEQIISFWDYRLSHHHDGGMAPDDVMDAMRDLMQALSIWPTLAAPRRADADEAAPRRRAALAS